VRRLSLTTWILIAVVVGAAFGYFFPAAATELRILSTIFIRLIRTIVAPLLFATLVVGIAGHGSLKQVGRMGVKAIIYFEIVTTLALLIGWAAITISRAGVGITLPPPAPGEQAAVPPPQTWQDILLHVFPENIAKAVADGEVLQVVVFSIIFGAALPTRCSGSPTSSCCLRRSGSARRSPIRSDTLASASS
jgi:proton glutamate symport protein